MKKLLYIILALVLSTTCLLAGCDNTVRPEGDYVPAVIDMTKTEKEFETIYVAFQFCLRRQVLQRY